MTELEICEGLQAGDNKCRKEFYTLTSGKLLTIGCRYLNDRELAEDILHDTYIQIFNSASKFVYREEGSLIAWAKKVMVNKCLDFIRKNAKVDNIPIETIGETIEDNEEYAEQIPPEVLLKLIGELPTGYRTVLNLFIFEGLTHKEIAEKLGINENSSSSQFFRAKSLLAKKLKDYLKF